MQNIPNINLDDLVQQIRILCPRPIADDEDFKIRQKLDEQLFQKWPRVELERLDLEYIIMNVKRSLSEFQKKIDESVSQQQLRRTTRIKKPVPQDPLVINFFNANKVDRKVFSSATIKSNAPLPACSNNKCCHKISELNDIVQVESLPMSASTSLLTIFVPSILQEKLHSCKYKISIDLNRLDLTKQILDLNVEQQVNLNQEANKKQSLGTVIEISEKCDSVQANELKITCGIKDDRVLENKEDNAETNIDRIVTDNSTTNEENRETIAAVESVASILIDKEEDSESTTGKKRGRKRLKPQNLSNDPPKKRGRKPGSKNKKKDEKSELAKYVEMFACNASSPSGVSQIVTSTTQNWEMPQQNGQIAYFMNGEWTLSAPPNSSHHLVSTTNNVVNLDEATNGQETCIPFEDFVNFIENPSLDAGNNVIARVLDGAGETAPTSINSQESDAIRFSVGIPLNAKNNLNTELNQPILPTTQYDGAVESLFKRSSATNMVHSTANDNEIDVNDAILDLSKDHSINTDPDVLDLTREKTEQILTSSAFDQSFHQSKNTENNSVIFSTGRSMPTLDDIDTDLFCSPRQSEHIEKSVIFSIQPSTPSFTSKCLRSPDDSIADSAIEVERKDSSSVSISESTKYTSNNKTKPDLMKGMSLLEIERNIDDSLLDFENCMDDDLLSLAPSSCFNSPTDDRFAESSVFGVNETNARPSSRTDSVEDSNTPRIKEIDVPIKKAQEHRKKNDEETVARNFRIPRRRSKEDLTDVVQIANNVSETNNLEKSSRIPSSLPHTEGCVKFSISCSQSNTAFDRNPAFKSPEAFTSKNVSKMFGTLCYNFLVDKCFEIFCKFSHQLLEPPTVMTSLMYLQNDVLNSSYRFIWRHYKLFKLYFPIFCEEFARRNMRRKLSNMITDCEMQSNCQHFLRNIYSALITCGLNRVNACRFILNRAKENCNATVDILLEIIIESEATMFSATIEQFALIPNYRFKMKDINALAATCLHSGSAELITVLIKCLINVDQVEFITFRSSELIQILEMIKEGAVSAL